MASDKQQFNRAMSKWESLGNDNHFSVPPELGRTAIISSPFTDEEPGTAAGIAELAAFRGEAIELADRVQTAGGKPELAIDATRHDITRLVQDPYIANVCTIGNGSLPTLLMDVDNRYDWADVSEATNHIKRGYFVQRQCGGLTRGLNVPLGMFTVSDPRNVFAPVGVEFYPRDLDDIENEKIQRVFTSQSIGYSTIKQLRRKSTQELDLLGLKQLARSQPKVESDGQSVEARSSSTPAHTEYRDNFFRRFVEVKAIADGQAHESQVVYVRTVKERFGLDLLRFYDEHKRLCDVIYEAVKAKEPYDKLVDGLTEVKVLEERGEIPEGSSRELNDATEHPLGIEAIGIFYWNQINPLLKEAYALIEMRTPNAPFLTK